MPAAVSRSRPVWFTCLVREIIKQIRANPSVTILHRNICKKKEAVRLHKTHLKHTHTHNSMACWVIPFCKWLWASSLRHFCQREKYFWAILACGKSAKSFSDKRFLSTSATCLRCWCLSGLLGFHNPATPVCLVVSVDCEWSSTGHALFFSDQTSGR